LIYLNYWFDKMPQVSKEFENAHFGHFTE